MFNLSLCHTTRVILIAVILFSALSSSTAFAQAWQESVFGTSSSVQMPVQGNRAFGNTNASIMFMENVGQFDPRALFVARRSNMNVYLAQNEIWFTLIEKTKENPRDHQFRNHQEEPKKIKAVNLKLVFPGSNPESKLEPFNKLEVRVSQFLGNNSSKQFADVPVWGGVRYVEFYPGADLEITSQNDELVWNILVRDLAKFSAPKNYISSHGLSIKIAGQKRLQLANGKVNINTDLGNLLLPQLLVKESGGGKVFIPILKEADDEIFFTGPGTLSFDPRIDGSFALASYDPKKNSSSAQAQTPQSPNLLFATLLGGGSDDIGYGQAAGPDGSMFVVGRTESAVFPEIAGYDEELSGISDAFIVKINSNGVLEYATYIGGSDFEDADSVAVNQNGEAYVVGSTASNDFPTVDAISTNPQHGFLVKLNATGDQLLYASYIGNSSTTLISTAIDADENVYMLSTDGTAYKLTLGSLTYGYEHSLAAGNWYSIAVNENGDAYFAGETDSNTDVRAAMITNEGALVYSVTFGGSSNDRGFGVAVDSNGFAYVTGVTSSTNFPSVGTPITDGTWNDAFVTILDPITGSIQYSSYLDVKGHDFGKEIAVDSQGSIYVTGETDSLNFPSTTGAVWEPGATDTGDDVFVVKIHPNMPLESYSIAYATKIGGSEMEFTDGFEGAIDPDGNVYVTGYTVSSDFVGTSGFSGNSWEVFAVKISTDNCIGTTLSTIAQAVQNSTNEQAYYCGNYYDSEDTGDGEIGLISLPPGQAAFARFGDLAETAVYEVDFVNMGWDEDSSPITLDSPGEFLLQGVKTLYDNVQQNPTNFPNGVRVRILVGLKYYTGTFCQDQRLTVMNDLTELGIELTAPRWSVEVAAYRDASQSVENCDYQHEATSIHSHAKMMVVDGEHVIAAGYNMLDDYLGLVPVHDMGIQISGPIAYRSLRAFDELWALAYRCDNKTCTQESRTESLENIPHDENVLIPSIAGNNVAFSLFRDHENESKTADDAIVAAIEAASSEVNIIQNRFMNFEFFDPPPYANAVINALEKPNVYVNLIVSGGNGETGGWADFGVNSIGVCNLYEQIFDQNPLGILRFDTRFSTTTNPIHTKALSIDDQFVIVGSQNFDASAWGDEPLTFGDLAEYSLGIDSSQAAGNFNQTFMAEWGDGSITVPLLCLTNLLQEIIDEAVPGSIIFVPSGVYPASITVNKPLVLVGAGANQTIIQAQGNQPAFRVTSSDVTILNMKISGGAGYGVELIDSSPSSLKNIRINSVVFENNAQGGILAQGLISGSPMNYTIENSTFIGGSDGVTINIIEPQIETSLIRNNIFFGQSNAPIHILSTNDSRVEYSYNLFDNCGAGNCVANWREGNMSVVSSAHDNLFDLDPLFANATKGAYQLSNGSPAIDSGDPSLLHEFLYDGDNDGTVQIDMGAFEYAPVTNVAPVVNAGNNQSVNLGSSATINATYTDADNAENHSAKINWGDGIVEDIAVNMTGPGVGGVNAQHTYSSVGNYTVEVCVTDIYGGVGCDTLNVEVISTPTACTPSDAYGSSPGGGAKYASFTSSNSVSFDRLPLSFVPNRGQEDQAVRFHAQGLGGKLFFAPNEVVFSLPNPVRVRENERDRIRYDLHPANVVRIHYQGANDNPEVVAVGRLPGAVNILRGNDRSKWRTNLPAYSGITYRELYPGIELRYEGINGTLKSTFSVAPGANPSNIVWRYRGVRDMSIDESGNLVVSLPEPAGTGATLIEQAPIAWQGVGENRVMVPVEYVLERNNRKVSFRFPNGYDTTLPLVIDPTLTYSTYLGGGASDQAEAVTLDADCNIYITGVTYSANFPTVNPIQANQPLGDVFVAKLNPAGNTLLFSTYLGGSEGDHALDIARDSQGRITIVGETESTNFPTVNAYQTSYGGGTCPDDACDDVFVTQLAADGSALRYSTYLGGNHDEEGHDIIVGPDDMVYLAGWSRSSTFPTTANAYDNIFGGGVCSGVPCEDAFVTKINPALAGSNSLLYSTFLGGNNYDRSLSIALDGNGHIYTAGYTRSDTYPTLNPHQAARSGNSDAFITKLDTALSGNASLLYSTFLGGTGSDYASGVALNGANQVYLTGWTRSTNFPLTNAFDPSFGGGTCGSAACYDAFVTYLNISNNVRVYSSYLGGSHEEQGSAITVDNNGNAYVTGYTKSTNFNTLVAIQASKAADACSSAPCADAFVTKVSGSGALVYSTYLGGTAEDYGNAIVVDELGSTYVVGYTFSSNFPGAINPFTGTSGYADAFVVKIED